MRITTIWDIITCNQKIPFTPLILTWLDCTKRKDIISHKHGFFLRSNIFSRHKTRIITHSLEKSSERILTGASPIRKSTIPFILISIYTGRIAPWRHIYAIIRERRGGLQRSCNSGHVDNLTFHWLINAINSLIHSLTLLRQRQNNVYVTRSISPTCYQFYCGF